jgi:hypothetical protein
VFGTISGEVHDEFLFCRSAEATFQTLADFIANNEVTFTRSANIGADGYDGMACPTLIFDCCFEHPERAEPFLPLKSC